MSRLVSVHLLPSLFEPAELTGGMAVIIDILRASTTMTMALANAAAGIVPCESIQQAESVRQEASTQRPVLCGGERGGVRIDGFELSNSPDDYGPEVVSGRTIAFTTTNGTRALLRATAADRILIGSFVNLSSVVADLQNHSLPIHLVCAGTDGRITGEDVLFAGAVLQQLTGCTNVSEIDAQAWQFSDAAVVALSCWLQQSAGQSLTQVLRTTQGGRNLIRLGFDHDIETAATVDQCSLVGVFDQAVGQIVTG